MVTGVLRRPDVEALTGLSRSTIYKFMKDGTLPEGCQNWSTAPLVGARPISKTGSAI